MIIDKPLEEICEDPEIWELRQLSFRENSKVVHLGNVGLGRNGEILSEKTTRYARRFPNINFYGIDITPFNPPERIFYQKKKDFIDGLNDFEDNSIDLISSDLAFGHYSRKDYEEESHGYIADTLFMLSKKIKNESKVLFSVGEQVAYDMQRFLDFCNFNFECRKFNRNEYMRTYWTRHYRMINRRVYQITASKNKIVSL